MAQPLAAAKRPHDGRLAVAHRTFFSFHYDDDVWRATNVRNSGALLPGDVEFIDVSLWEKAEASSDVAVKRLIDDALERATVTAVLIGSDTASRRWVKYEIDESIRLKKGLFGVYIHNIGDQNGKTTAQGANAVPDAYPVYYWYGSEGAENLGKWVEAAYDATQH